MEIAAGLINRLHRTQRLDWAIHSAVLILNPTNYKALSSMEAQRVDRMALALCMDMVIPLIVNASWNLFVNAVIQSQAVSPLGALPYPME